MVAGGEVVATPHDFSCIPVSLSEKRHEGRNVNSCVGIYTVNSEFDN